MLFTNNFYSRLGTSSFTDYTFLNRHSLKVTYQVTGNISQFSRKNTPKSQNITFQQVFHQLFVNSLKLCESFIRVLSTYLIRTMVVRWPIWSQSLLLLLHPVNRDSWKGDTIYSYSIPDNVGNDVYLKKVVTTEINLGVTFDCNLTFEHYITNIIIKAQRCLGCIYRPFKHLDKDMFLQLHVYK